MEPSLPPDLRTLAESLNRHGVDYLLIGGLAVVVHGGSIMTQDGDISVAVGGDNLDRLVDALSPFHPRPLRLAPGAAWEFDRKCIRGPWSLFQTDVGRFDIILSFPEPFTYRELKQRADMADLNGVLVPIISIPDLIAIKKIADRDKDRLHVRELEIILERRERLSTENG